MLETKHMIRNLISNLNIDDCINNSCKNYHTVGLDYINILRTDRLTLKLYFIDPSRVQPSEDGYFINLHNHRYNFSTQVLYGSVSHLLFEEREGNDWFRYDYNSDNSKDSRFQLVKETGLTIVDATYYESGESYLCDIDQIHTLKLAGEPTCLLLHQYNDIMMDGTKFYSRNNTPPTLDNNLYQGFSEDEIYYYLAKVKYELDIMGAII
jgi:hypothetical protein